MESLLRWSIENSTSSSNSNDPAPAQPRRDLDPEIIDLILGKPDSVLMKEALDKAVDESLDDDARVLALDEFEMFVEQIDNANNISKLNMWPTLQTLLTNFRSSNEIKANVLWIIGTAMQNNPEAQNSYISYPDSLSSILSHLSSLEVTSAVRSKAAYALSGLLKHNAAAVRQMDELDGWNIVKGALQDPDITVRRKIIFLISTLLIPSTSQPSTNSTSTAQMHSDSSESPSSSAPVHPNSHASMTPQSTHTSPLAAAALQKTGLLEVIVESIIDPVPHGKDGEVVGDVDCLEKGLRLVHTYLISCHGSMPDSERVKLREWMEKNWGGEGQWDLTKAEVEELKGALQ